MRPPILLSASRMVTWGEAASRSFSSSHWPPSPLCGSPPAPRLPSPQQHRWRPEKDPFLWGGEGLAGEQVTVNMYSVTVGFQTQQEGCWADFRGTSRLREWGDSLCRLKPLAQPILILGFSEGDSGATSGGTSPVWTFPPSPPTQIPPQELGGGFQGLHSRMRVGQGK